MTNGIPGARARARRVAPELMITLGILAFSLFALLSTARRALFFPDNFALNLATSLGDPRVASFVADRVTDAILKEEPDLTAFRPLILATAEDAVASPPFQALVRGAARAAHASLFSEGGRTVIVSIPDVGVLVRSALLKANPSLAAKVPERARGALASIGQRRSDQFIIRPWQAARRSLWLAGALLLSGLLLTLSGVLLAFDRRVALVRFGLDLLVAGFVFMLLVPGGRAVVGLIPQTTLAREAAAFTESGLEALVYKGPAGPPWPTLREMIDTRERVLVTIESGRPGFPWIRPAFEVMQETLYKFNTPSELSCAPKRGGTSGSLFLMNNWVDTTPAPKPSNAKIVNGYEALLTRAKECRAARGRWPNLVAVDFYRTGDLFRAVRKLNDEAAPAGN